MWYACTNWMIVAESYLSHKNDSSCLIYHILLKYDALCRIMFKKPSGRWIRFYGESKHVIARQRLPLFSSPFFVKTKPIIKTSERKQLLVFGIFIPIVLIKPWPIQNPLYQSLNPTKWNVRWDHVTVRSIWSRAKHIKVDTG